MKNTLLSIGMIVKNEIRCLERCLKSLEPLRKTIPSELVIADTGSTDGSREIAAKYADILFDFKWNNSFSAARNAVLEKCSGDWYLTIDADEWLEDIQELVSFLTGKDSQKVNMAMIYQRNYTNKRLTFFCDSPVPRMGKRLGGALRYMFPIHEVLYFTDGTKNKDCLLANTFLHHDGYLGEDADKKRAKNERNMKLLRIEQEKKPQDLRVLTQCLQSAVDTEEMRTYLNIAQEKVLDKNAKDPYLPILLKNMLMLRLKLKDYRRLEKDLEVALSLCPQSYMIRLDGHAYAAMAAFFQENWESTLDHSDKWAQALEELIEGKDQNQPERFFSSYDTRDPGTKTLMHTLKACSLAQVGDHAAAAEQLPLIQLELLDPPNDLTLLTAISMGAATQPKGKAWLRHFWSYIQLLLQTNDAERRRYGHILQEKTLDVFRRQFPEGKLPTPMAYALAALEDIIPGQSAQILLAETPETIEKKLQEITDWSLLFPEAYFHIMELNLMFPPSFYDQNRENFAALAARLAQADSICMVRVTAHWLTRQPFPETPSQLTWQLALITAIIQNYKEWDDISMGQQLCTLYGNLAFTYLDNIYNPDILNEEDISILPGMQRFAWYFRQALTNWEQGEMLGYVRALRAGLDTAPAMKDLVNFLLDHVVKP